MSNTDTIRGNRPHGEVPLDVRTVVTEVAEYLGVPVGELFVADHTHEEVSEGSWTIALEGHEYDWPWHFTEKRFRDDKRAPEGWGLEAKNGVCLLVYRDRDPKEARA